MTFLHNNCEFEISSLSYIGNKSEFVKAGKYSGKIKPIGLEDETFNLSEVKGEKFKITYKGDLHLSGNERIEILTGRFAGKYNLKEFRKHKGISFSTTKILLVKI